MKTVFLHLDPFVKSEKMNQHRIREYILLQQKLELRGGSNVYWLIGKSQFELERKFLWLELRRSNLRIKLLVVDASPRNSIDSDLYCSMAQAGYLPDDVMQEYLMPYKSINIRPDVIITNTPSLIIKRVWSESLILHYELGFFQRGQYSNFITLDPLGYSYRSLIARIGSMPSQHRASLARYVDLYRVMKIRSKIDSHASFEEKVEGVFVPLTSGRTWVSKLESYASDPVSEVREALLAFPNQRLFVAEKPQYRLSDETNERIKKLSKDVHVLSAEGEDGIGNLGASRFGNIFTSSSSMALQGLYWGAKTRVPVGHPMHNWTLLEQDALQNCFDLAFGLTQLNRQDDDLEAFLDKLAEFMLAFRFLERIGSVYLNRVTPMDK